MTYKKVNMDEFKRKMYFEYFMSTGTTLDVTAEINVAKALSLCKKQDISFYGYSIHCLTNVVNSTENMRYDLLDDKLILWDELIPSFTNFNNVAELFYALWIENANDYIEFDKRYKMLVHEFKNCSHISPRGNEPDNLFHISSIPWLNFKSISASNKFSSTTLLPVVSMGKYQGVDENIMMPVNIKAHHATMDGFHISLFFSKLQREMNRDYL